MAEAILFDCDGVLVDSEPASARAWRQVLAARGVGGFDHRIWVGRTDRELAEHYAPLVGVASEALEAMAVEVLIDELAAGVGRFEDAVSAHMRLQELGFPTAVVTNSTRRRLDAVLAAAGVEVAVSLCADDVARPKPSPDVYLAAAEALGVEAADCLVFEDSASGVSAALAAGMQVIVVDRGDPPAVHADLPSTTDVAAVLSKELGFGNLA